MFLHHEDLGSMDPRNHNTTWGHNAVDLDLKPIWRTSFCETKKLKLAKIT